jgi:hypothetical protein
MGFAADHIDCPLGDVLLEALRRRYTSPVTPMFPGERSLDASLAAVFVQRPTHAMSFVPRMPTLTAKISPSSIPQPMSKPSVPARRYWP